MSAWTARDCRRRDGPSRTELTALIPASKLHPLDRISGFWLLVGAALVGCLGLAPLSRADGIGLDRKHHPWARFEPGAWKKVRVVTETLDEAGAVQSTSITDTTTKLVGVSEDDYQLQINMTVEVAGKKFAAEPQDISHGLYGEASGQTSVQKLPMGETVIVEGKEVPCEVYQVQMQGEDTQRVTKIYYAKDLSPYVLKKETVQRDAAGENVLYRSQRTVLAREMPHKVLAEMMSTAVVRTVHTSNKGTTVTLSVETEKMPGGVVSSSTKELDPQGRVIRRSTLELVEYGVESDFRVMRRGVLFRRKALRGRMR